MKGDSSGNAEPQLGIIQYDIAIAELGLCVPGMEIVIANHRNSAEFRYIQRS